MFLLITANEADVTLRENVDWQVWLTCLWKWY